MSARENKGDTQVMYDGKIEITLGAYHRYLLSRKGGKVLKEPEKIISVTKATGMLDKPGVKFWAANLTGDHIREFWKSGEKYTDGEKESIIAEGVKQHSLFKEKKATIGSAVHDFAEQVVKGLKPALPKDPMVRKGALAFLRWFEGMNMRNTFPEHIVYHTKHNYTGKLDLDASVKGTPCIIDYKTSSMWETDKREEDGFARGEDGERIVKDVYWENKLQTSAYRAARMLETGKVYGDSIVVRFDTEDGGFDVTVLPAAEQDKDFQAFLGLLEAAKRFEELGLGNWRRKK